MSPPPRLIAITDLGVLAAQLLVARVERLATSAVPGSVAVVLRDHAASARERLELGRELRRVTRDAGQELWVADRLDLALLLDADGAHLGEASVPAAAARRLLGPGRRISRAWHRTRLAGATDELQGVDALLLSPVFAARKGRPALGISGLAQALRTLAALGGAPRVYALGGVGGAEAAQALAAGAWGVAALGAALRGDAEALLDALAIRRG